MPIVFKLILLSTGFCSGLIAGLFYAYSCSVNVGLARLSDIEYLRAMQSINRVILNPWFFSSFMGTLLLLPIAVWMAYTNTGISTSTYLLLTAALIYLVGVFGVTIFGNVPLNQVLDKLDFAQASVQDLALQRSQFENTWNKFHLLRTLGSSLTLLLTLSAILFRL